MPSSRLRRLTRRLRHRCPRRRPHRSPRATPSDAAITIAEARALNGRHRRDRRGRTLTESAFADGGGYLADASGGIAVLLSDGSFPRGQQVRVDRHGRRSLQPADHQDRCERLCTVIGPAAEPAAAEASTGAIGEAFEGELVVVAGTIASSPTTLTTGIAVDLDDGSGAVRVMVGDATGIDTAGWTRGASLRLRGVVGQRDSSGTGTAGYRVQPRDAADVLGFPPPPSPPPAAAPTPSPSGDPSVVSIAGGARRSRSTAA